MQGITTFLAKKLKLRVNTEKSAVDRPWNRKFLGFTFHRTRQGRNRRTPAPQSVKRFKDKIRAITRRSGGRSIEQVVAQLNPYLKGWMAYFGYAEVNAPFQELNSWIRRRFRCMLWKQWGSRRYRELRARGVNQMTAWVTSKSGHGPWRLSHSPAVQQALGHKFFLELGLPTLVASLLT